MKSLVLSITLLFAYAASIRATEVAKNVSKNEKHTSIKDLVHEGKASIVAAITAYERESKNTAHPHHAKIKKDLETLKKIKSSTVAEATKYAKELSQETREATEALFKHLNALGKVKAFKEWKSK